MLERARAALERAGDPPGPRAEVLLALAGARIHLGDVVPGKALCCEVAATLARARPRRPRSSRAARPAAVSDYGVVDPVMVDLLEGALAALPPGDSVWRARLLARLAGALQPSDDPAEPAAIAREAIATARRLGDRRALLETMFDDALSALEGRRSSTRVRGALNLEVEALTLAEGDRERLLRTHARLALDHRARRGRAAPTRASTPSRRWRRTCGPRRSSGARRRSARCARRCAESSPRRRRSPITSRSWPARPATRSRAVSR